MSEREEIRTGLGFGFKADDGRIYLKRCFRCGRENYAMAVASGTCAWCGFDANREALAPAQNDKSTERGGGV